MGVRGDLFHFTPTRPRHRLHRQIFWKTFCQGCTAPRRPRRRTSSCEAAHRRRRTSGEGPREGQEGHVAGTKGPPRESLERAASDVLERPYTVGGGGGTSPAPPLPPPPSAPLFVLPMFEAESQNFASAPQHSGPDPTPRAFPYPNNSPNRILQPPVTAPPTPQPLEHPPSPLWNRPPIKPPPLQAKHWAAPTPLFWG